MANLPLAAARVPFVQHGLPLSAVYLPERHPRAGLLFFLQVLEALRPSHTVFAFALARARYSTYFFYIIKYKYLYLVRYGTVLLRIPKKAIRHSEEGFFAFFGFVNGFFLWISLLKCFGL